MAGADEIIDFGPPIDRHSIRDQVYRHTLEEGVDVLIDVIGGDIFDAAIRSVGWKGRAVVVGFDAGRIEAIKVNYLLSKNIEVSGLDWFKYRENCPKLIAKVQAEVFRLFAEEKIRSHVDQRIPFKRISEAVELIRERKVIGRIALTWP